MVTGHPLSVLWLIWMLWGQGQISDLLPWYSTCISGFINLAIEYLNQIRTAFSYAWFFAIQKLMFTQWLSGCILNFQELEQALGEVEFKEGIPDVKFSRVRVIFKKNSNWICVSDDCANHCLWVSRNMEIIRFLASFGPTLTKIECIIHYLKLTITEKKITLLKLKWLWAMSKVCAVSEINHVYLVFYIYYYFLLL